MTTAELWDKQTLTTAEDIKIHGYALDCKKKIKKILGLRLFTDLMNLSG